MKANRAQALETLETVTNQMAAAVTRCSRDFRYLWANQAYAEWIQRPLNEIVERPILDVLGKEAFEALLPHFNEVLAGKTVRYEQETNFRGIGPRWISAAYNPTFDTNGATNGWVAVVVDITERRKAEQAQRESEEGLRLAAKAARMFAYSWDAATDVIECSGESAEILGVGQNSATGAAMSAMVHPDDKERLEDAIAKLTVESPRLQITYRMIRSDGAVIWLDRNSCAYFDNHGRIKGMVGMVADITERKRGEQAVNESEQRFRLVADTAPVLIWMSGVDKLCTYFNKPWLNFTGRSMESELGNGWAEGVHSEDLQRCMDTYTQAFDRREAFQMEYRLRRHDGEYRWIFDIGVPRYGRDQSFAGYIGSCIDETEQKRAKDTLRKSEERFRLAAQAGKMYAYEWDVTTDVLARSSEYADILGLTEPERFTRQQFMDKIHVDDRAKFTEAISQLTPDNPTSEVTYRFVSPDGALIWLKNRGRAFFDGEGRMMRVIGMVADVTDYKRAEEAVSGMTRKLIEAQEQERTRIGRELHDNITQRLALLAIELNRFQENHSYLPPEAHTHVRELHRMTSDISSDVHALSHELHSSTLEFLGLVTGMRSWCKEFGARRKLEIAFQSQNVPELPQEISLCLYRVLQEALQNAAKHSGTKRLEVKLAANAGDVHLIVRDSGQGFDSNAPRRSRGLGLTSMQERVRLVGGTIVIDSKPMAGTTIDVCVPLRGRARSAASGNR